MTDKKLIFNLHNTDDKARRGDVSTAHGTFQTPAFMPVGTYGAVKSLSPEHLNDVGAEIFSQYVHLCKGRA